MKEQNKKVKETEKIEKKEGKVPSEEVKKEKKKGKTTDNLKKVGKDLVRMLTKYSLLPFIVIGIALFFLSMLLTAQMKTISKSEEVIAGKREDQLADDLVTLQRKYNELKEQSEQNQKVVEEYQNNSSTNNTLISSMTDQINQLSMLAGTTDLKGEGIVMTLTDGTKVTDPSLRSDSLVHDSDILTVVNELKAAGAEAISVNGQRIIATSAIRCVGPVIQVNYQKVAAPFEIKAIGNAQYLESAMNIKSGVADMLKQLGVGVTISRQNNVEIPKYEGTFGFKNATVVK